MRNKIILAANIAVLLIFLSCKKEALRFQSLTVQVGKCSTYNTATGELTYCLDSVITDSRCPANANCAVIGYAAARFIISKNNVSEIVTLAVKPGMGDKPFPVEARVLGHTITFETLDPYPGLAPNNYDDFKATLNISDK